MLLQAALNGDLTKATHPAVPVSTEDLGRDAAACATAGAGAIHMHPRDSQGRERLDPAVVDEVHAELDRVGLTAPRLQHGDGEATWVLIEDAIRRGIDTRVGLEDTQYEPSGERTAGNEALVRAAQELAAGAG